MVMPPYYPFPVFSLITPTKTHKSEKYTPATQSTGGYPLTILTCLQFKFLLTFRLPNPQLRCQKITEEPLAPALACIIPGRKGKQSEEQVVMGDFFFLRRLRCHVWWQLGVIQDVKAHRRQPQISAA